MVSYQRIGESLAQRRLRFRKAYNDAISYNILYVAFFFLGRTDALITSKFTCLLASLAQLAHFFLP